MNTCHAEKNTPKILMVYPEYPTTFWSFKHALRFVSKRAAFPPLGLLTVAAMLPGHWPKRLIDMNVTSLRDEDLKWADYVFISAMIVQRDSARQVIDRCQGLGVKTVAGGPMFTAHSDEFDDVDHLVLNEAEVTLSPFLADMENGCPRHIYTSTERPDICETPSPLWDLLDMRKYSLMSVQYSRGCPYDCEFCDITALYGRVPRTKDSRQLIKELEALYSRGWRGSVFVVDDNFIGNKRKLKAETLPAVVQWMKDRRYPFSLSTEASINLADDEELMEMMAESGFNTVFVGIETPDEESLAECGKLQNKGRDLIASIRKIQRHGFQVLGGFIVGFDSDPPSIFERQISFIQKSGIVTAMVGLLNAPRGTRLYKRLKAESRILSNISGDNTDGSLNFTPKMEREALVNGYRKVLETIYSPRSYYERVKVFLKEYRPRRKQASRFQFAYLQAFVRSLWHLGLKDRGRVHYWKLLWWTLLRCPRSLHMTLSLAVYGFHFRIVARSLARSPVSMTGQKQS